MTLMACYGGGPGLQPTGLGEVRGPTYVGPREDDEDLWCAEGSSLNTDDCGEYEQESRMDAGADASLDAGDAGSDAGDAGSDAGDAGDASSNGDTGA